MIARTMLVLILILLFALMITPADTRREEFGAVIYVPKNYNGEPTPILYWLHWYRGNAYACSPMKENPNFIIVAPKFNGSWKDFNLVGLIERVEQKYPASERYLEGYSRGAYGAAYHAAQNPGVFLEVWYLAGAYPDFPQVTDPIKLYAGSFDERWKHSTVQYAENLGTSVIWVNSTHDPTEFYGQLKDRTDDPRLELPWTNQMPTEPGWYWFYGNRYEERECELATVHVWKISNGVAHVCGGAFMYESDLGETRWFQRITEPELP